MIGWRNCHRLTSLKLFNGLPLRPVGDNISTITRQKWTSKGLFSFFPPPGSLFCAEHSGHLTKPKAKNIFGRTIQHSLLS